MSARIGRPARSARARRERAAALRAVITAIDSGTLRIDGTHPSTGPNTPPKACGPSLWRRTPGWRRGRRRDLEERRRLAVTGADGPRAARRPGSPGGCSTTRGSWRSRSAATTRRRDCRPRSRNARRDLAIARDPEGDDRPHQSQVPDETGPLAWRWAEEVGASTPEEPDWLLEEYFAPGDKVMLAGRTKVGKSTWVEALVRAIASEEGDHLHRPSGRTGSAMLVSEEGDGTLAGKVEGLPPERLECSTAMRSRRSRPGRR